MMINCELAGVEVAVWAKFAMKGYVCFICLLGGLVCYNFF